MTQNNNDLDKINKNIYIKAYLVGIVPFLILVWFLGKAFESSFIQTLLIIGGIFLVWTIFKSIITSITFALFLKNDLIQKYLHEFRANDFPKPQDYEVEEVEAYLQSVAMDPNNHPQNVLAGGMLSEFGHARAQGSMLVLLRLNKVMKEALRQYSR